MTATQLRNEEEFGLPENATLDPATVHAHLEEQQANAASASASATTNRIPLTMPQASAGQAPLQQEKLGHRKCIVVGRQAAAVDIHIPHPSISRKHAALFCLPGGSSDHSMCTASLHIVDGGGKYGTFVNDTKIPARQPQVLQNGDTIAFGNVRDRIFTVKIDERRRLSARDDDFPGADKSDNTTGPVAANAGEGLEGRAKREAEIAAMVDSLDQVPAYENPTQLPEQSAAASSDTEVNASASSNIAITAEKYGIPIHLVEIESESSRRNLVTCLAVDPAGSRFVVGSTDAHLRFYDFGGMARNRMGSFQTAVPQEGQPLVSCAYSNTGDRILVATSGVQPVVLDRDGNQVVKFIRGDMYVSDMSKTVGHTFAVTAVDWHPLERDWVITSSQDGSARLWNLQGKTQFDMLVCDKVFQAKNTRGLRTAVLCICFHPSGREFALGTACGSIQIWNHARVSNRPERVVYEAHGKDNATTSLVFNTDGSQIGSRSISDDVVKIWNTPQLSRSSAPLVVCENLSSLHEQANLAFSPDGRIICAGASAMSSKAVEGGQLHFFDIAKAKCEDHTKPVLSIDWDQGSSPVIVKWHSKLKQVLVGCSNGKVAVYYDPYQSKNGALLVSSKMDSQVDGLASILRTRADASGAVSGQVITPFSLPLYREDHTSEKKRKRQERKDPSKSKEPERPATGKHKVGGQEGSNVTFAQFVADRRVAKSKAIAGTDPRDALLRFGNEPAETSQEDNGQDAS